MMKRKDGEQEAAAVILAKEEIELMEKTADELGLSTIRYWEKKME